MGPSLTTGRALCLVAHIVYYRGSKKYTQIKTFLSGDERSNLAPDRYTCTMILVFYSIGCEEWTEDWTAKEDSPQEGFTGLTTPHFA